MAEHEVVARITADTRDYERNMDRAAASASKVDAAAKRVDASWKKTAAGMLAAGAAATYAGTQILQAVNESINAAGRLSSATGKMERTFGLASVQIKSFARNSVDSLGMSKRATYEAAVTIGELGKNAGLSTKSSAEFATSLVKLATQMANFKETTPEEAITAITQALNGGTQGVARYGVVINDAMLRQRAFDMGLVSSTKQALTPYARALAVQAELLDQTTSAQKYSEESTGSLADAQQRFAASLEDMRAALGETLLPLMIQGVDVATEMAQVIGGLPEPIRDTTVAIVAMAGGFLALSPAILAVVNAMKTLGPMIGLTGARVAMLSPWTAAAAVVGGSLAWNYSNQKAMTPEEIAAGGALAGQGYNLSNSVGGLNTSLGSAGPAFNQFQRDASAAGSALDQTAAAADGAASSIDGAGDAAQDAGENAGEAATEFDKFGNAITESYKAAQAATGILFDYINAQLALAGATDAANQAISVQTFQNSIRGPATTVRSGGGSTAADTAARKANTDAINKQIDALRKKDAAERDAEIEAARRAAKRKAENRADAQARRDVRKGIAGAIATDKKARRGEDIDGFNQTGSVGEYAGTLTDKEQEALDKKISGIRARHTKALNDDIKALREAAKAATASGRAASSAGQAYLDASTSLDGYTSAGLRNRATIQAGLKAIAVEAEAAGRAVFEATEDPVAAAKASEEVLTTLFDTMMQNAEDAGFSTKELKDYLDEINLTKYDILVRLKYVVEVDDTALKQLDDEAEVTAAKKAVRATRKPTHGVISPKKAATSISTGVTNKLAGFHASGGKIYGPGTSTSDDVPLWGSRDEWVIRASSAAKYGDAFMSALNNGTLSLAQFAAATRGAGGAGASSASPLVGSITVQAAKPDRAGRNVIDALAEVAYRHGVVR